MPDIITIAAGGGHAQHTTALECMVHYKLGTPQFFDTEQINAGSWRLVRQNPAEATLWHPKNDNLEGVDTVYGGKSYYGSRDHNGNIWSVPFNEARPAHAGQTSYSYPDEMFISNVAMTKWIYFPRSLLTMDAVANGTEKSIYASNFNSSPHVVPMWLRAANAQEPLICTDGNFANAVYHENNTNWPSPADGSLVFVRRAALPTAGSGQPSGA